MCVCTAHIPWHKHTIARGPHTYDDNGTNHYCDSSSMTNSYTRSLAYHGLCELRVAFQDPKQWSLSYGPCSFIVILYLWAFT